MKIHNGQLFWPLTYDRKPHTNPPVKPMYDVIIVGAGMSGLLTASQLVKEGLRIAILEMKEAVKGSTSANTGLLQWTNDIMLHELIELIGDKNAVRFHELCQEAINDIEELATTMPDNGDFIRRPSICYASKKSDVKKLEKEFDAMTHYGFNVEFWNDHIAYQNLKWDVPAAIKTFQDAEINPYKFGAQLLEQLIAQGVDLFEHTFVNTIDQDAHMITLRCLDKVFHTKDIIFTTGYHPVPYGKIIGANVNRSYAIVTNQIENFEPWHESAMIWETDRPYFYLRRTVDNRIVIGGLDETKSKAPKDASIEEHAQQLVDYVIERFPHYDIVPIAMYGASFGESKDHLPFIGEHPEHPHLYYLLGYGGNGTVYSMLGAKILADLLTGRPNADAHIVSLDRKYGAK